MKKRRYRHRAALACAIAIGTFLPSSSDARMEEPGAHVLQGEEAISQLKKDKAYKSLTDAFVAAQYAVESAPGTRGEGGSAPFAASNPAQSLRANFTSEDVRVRSSGTRDWGINFKLLGYGYGSDIVRLASGGTRARENRVELDKHTVVSGASVAVTEWYENKPAGLEQGFTIYARPPGEVPSNERLRIVLSITGDFQPEFNRERQSLNWKDPVSGDVATYDHLKAWDATGRELPAQMEVNGSELALEVDDNGATYPLTIDPILQGQVEVTAPDGAKLDELGSSVAISGNTAVVGAPFVKSGSNQRTGAAYVFVRNGADWAFQQKLLTFDTPLDGNTVYNFGTSVGISGNTIVVGSQPNGFDNRVPFNGVAHIFVRTGTTWSPQQKLMANDGSGGDYFGISVAISGDTVIVGSEFTVINAELEAGEAFIFSRNGTTWTKQAKLLEPVTALRLSYFGASVAVNGDTAVVGSPIDSNNGNGAAYVFVRSNNVWSVQPPLLPSNPSGADEFGNSVSVSGDTIIVGAPAHDVNGVNDQGAAYVFTRTGNAWSQQQILTASDGSVGNVFGNSVAISGNQLVIGAHLAYVNGVQQQGKAYRFARLATTWLPVAAPDGRPFLTAADGSDFTAFGVSVAISGDTVIAGAVGLNNSTGAAYIFQTLDSDGDGIPDDWESRGITVASNGTIAVGNTGSGEFIDLPAMGANPMHKDIFIHADWMTGIKPNARTIKVVTDAFRDAPVTNPDGKKGINLHIDLGSDSVMDPVSGRTWGAKLSRSGPESSQTTIGVDSPNANPPPANVYNWGAVDTLKDDYFNAAKRKSVFHYLLFCNKYATRDSSGISRGIPAGDFLVALGQVPGATLRQIAGTLMHELGHNLGLLHGGNEDVNMKPNYLSIMSYTFQMEGLLARDRRSRILDYSHSTLDPLNENSLNENIGINDPEGHLTLWKWPAPTNNFYNQAFYPSAALDWNLDGVQNDAPVSVNLNCDTTVEPDCDTKLTTLTGFNDWPALIFAGDGAIGNSAAGVEVFQPQRTVEDEASFSDIISLIPPGLLAQDAVEPLDVVTFSPQQTTTGSTVSFDGSGSTAVTGTIVSWKWDFGDGTTGTGPIVSHVYTAAGDYVVTLMVTDSNGNVNMTPLRYIVTVAGIPTPTPTPTPSATPTPGPTPTPPPGPGQVDPTFTATATLGYGASVSAFVTQPDGKTLVGGLFTSFGGRARRGIARINPDGTCDTTFDPGLALTRAVGGALVGGMVKSLALQPDGKILVGVQYQSRVSNVRIIFRLNPDGTPDPTFDTSALDSNAGTFPGVFAIALQPDGKILIGGEFLYNNGGTRASLARLNADGSVDASFVAANGGPNGDVYALALQPDGKVVVGGGFQTIDYQTQSGPAGYGIARFNSDGSLDTGFNVVTGGVLSSGFGFVTTVNGLALLGDGRIIVGGALKSPDPTKTIPPFARLKADGSRDTYADGAGVLGYVEGLTLQPDGKVIAVGRFQIGNPAPTSADVVRLNADGTIDGSFAVGDGTLNANGSLGSLGVHAIAMQTNGKLVIGGDFAHFNDTFAESILQLNADGSRDPAFAANGPGFNNQVSALLRQPDGKLLVGFFTNGGGSLVGDTPRTKLNSLRIGGLGRLNPDGTTDGTFTTPFDNGSVVSSMALQADGKIVLSGTFTLIGPTTNPQFQCTRLNPDGTIDSTFNLSTNPSLQLFSGPIAIQPDGKILTSGYDPSGFPGVVRLNADGSRDPAFSAPLPNGGVTEIALQPDGRIVIGGTFRIPGGKLERLGRLNDNGSFDTTFNTGDGPDNTVWALLLQPDGKILISGKFNNYNGTPRTHIARVNPDGSLDSSFTPANPADADLREIRALALQLDGKIVAGRYDGGDTGVPPPNRIFRLNADGSLNSSLPQTGTGVEGMSTNVNAIALQPGGNIVIGGEFNIVNGAARLALARIIGAAPTVLANISTRLRVESGDNALIGGFIITGTGQKKVLLRAIGPSLPIDGHLNDPVLELYANGQPIATNDNWNDAPNRQEIIDSTIPPTNDLESAILTNLNPGAYTAIMRGVNDTTGIGVVEAYDLDSTAGSKLANISTRGLVQTGDNVLIAGTIVVGQASQKVIIRALGPSTGVPGAMADPTLELRDANGNLLEANDNWVDSPNKQAIIDSTIPPPNNVESAIVRTLTPANYTAIVRGANNTTGIAVVEVYALN
jgi:uncharacterized delta-60 repeat protein